MPCTAEHTASTNRHSEAGSRPRLAVVGSVNLDLVARCERLPRPGETVTDATFARHPGGKGGNQAVAAARLGADVQLACAVGEDAFADEALRELRESGVRVSATPLDEHTGVALIYVDAGGETEIVVAPGANARLAPTFPLDDHDAVLCQLEIPMDALRAAAERCAGLFFLNAAPAKPVAADVLRRADVVVVNRYEYEALAESPALVALTLGADGAALLEAGREVTRVRPPVVEAVDGTAAGDAFAACLAVSMIEGRDASDALRRACAAGALAASRPGAQPSLPTAAEVDEILAR